MRFSHLLITALLVSCIIGCQEQEPNTTVTNCSISFENAIHHEAEISIELSDLKGSKLEMRMARSSPGRYALHEFAKNVYNVRATNSKGEDLEVLRPNPHQWDVLNHDGQVTFKYTLFANRGGGTYSQVDETHAHLNIPATFAYANNYPERPIQVNFQLRDDLNWKVATQLKHLKGSTYWAPDFQYFMDSPTEIAGLHFREQEIDGQIIRLALHTPADSSEVDDYFQKVISIVNEQKKVFGELPIFDFGAYTFLSCYVPNASGDGMEHRNSTYVVSSKSLEKPLGETSIGTISHEFFHAWNVERLRPQSLEPFDFAKANMSGELWFAEGFTSYYTGLILARAGIRSDTQYIEGLANNLNYVLNSPGRNYFNPIEMSNQAPFVDAARSVDPTNRSNTFISYYSYGSALGLALDLTLRSVNKDLDEYMRLLWEQYGSPEIPFTIEDLQSTLATYAGQQLSDTFFKIYIYDSQAPDYKSLFDLVGVHFRTKNAEKAYLGANFRRRGEKWRLSGNPDVGSPIYNAGINSSDEILSINDTNIGDLEDIDGILDELNVGEEIDITIYRFGKKIVKTLTPDSDPSYETAIDPDADSLAIQRRNLWLGKTE